MLQLNYMKILILESKFKSRSVEEHHELVRILKESQKTDVQLEYFIPDNFLKGVKVKNGSIVQSSISYTGKYDWVHVRLSYTEWRKLKLRKKRYGEHQKVNGVSITYGRWSKFMKDKRGYLVKHEFPGIPEHVLGMLHEFIHGREGSMAIAHSYLYGYPRLYTKAQERAFKPKRYSKPSSLKKALEWVFMKSKVYKVVQKTKANLTYTKKKYKYFSEDEVKGLKHEFVLKLDKAREIAGIPFSINSGYRTPEHNKKVGGVPNSAHTHGVAVDLRARNGKEIYIIVDSLMQAGIKRIGINWGKNFVHADVSTDKPSPTVWKY
ncbi:MAG: hypothetical protein KAS32_00040 [Candidatus Peribacteraceae bacterium]|nr:hypothetical protein [Candidatus Peribacteraceae bacterium]